jgi:hypothetical protein
METSAEDDGMEGKTRVGLATLAKIQSILSYHPITKPGYHCAKCSNGGINSPILLKS